jgi:galactosylceramidase
VKWIKGLKSTYDLDLDAIGCRNERGAVTFWAKLFRATLDREGLKSVRLHGFDNCQDRWDWVHEMKKDKALADAIAVASNHTLALGEQSDEVIKTLADLGKPIWNTEEHPYNGEGRNYPDDYAATIGTLHLFNENFIARGATKIVNWYLVGSTYHIEPYADQPPAMIANSPWSGHYDLKPNLWAYAHYGQFTRIGWRYVSGGCAMLADGGSVVTLRSANGGDYSVIAETAGAKQPQTVTFKLAGDLSQKSLCVWRSTRTALFERQADVSPADGVVTITLEPDAMYSLSTTAGQQKGTFADVPPARPFPLPYHETFDHYGDAKPFGYLPHYTADICGVFEIADRPDKAGKCLKQVTDHKPQSWAPEWMPYTILGDESWKDYEISADVLVDDGWAGVMGHITATGNGWNGNPNAYYVRLYADGGVALYEADQRLSGAHERQLAVGNVAKWQWHRWHNVTLRFVGTRITVLIDGAEVLTGEAKNFDHGLAGLITAGEGDDRHTALFDNLIVKPVGADRPEPTAFSQDQTPMYAK